MFLELLWMVLEAGLLPPHLMVGSVLAEEPPQTSGMTSRG